MPAFSWRFVRYKGNARKDGHGHNKERGVALCGSREPYADIYSVR